MPGLSGQVALVTGGASGIGRAVVERFVQEGASVGVLDLAPKALEEPRFGDSLLSVEGDVTRYEDCAAAVTATIERFGKLDVVVANAGIIDGFRPLVALEPDVLEQIFDQVIAVNLKGYLLISKAALPWLFESEGTIIFTLSNSSFYPNGGGAAYVASKHADLGLLRQLAWELAPTVRVNGVSPGGTRSPMALADAVPAAGSGPDPRVGQGEDLDALLTRIAPLARVSPPEDHAGAYVLLADRSSNRSMTGTVIESDGGLGVRGIMATRGGFRPQAAETTDAH